MEVAEIIEEPPLDVNNKLFDYLSSVKSTKPYEPVEIRFYGDFVDSTSGHDENSFLELIKGSSIVRSEIFNPIIEETTRKEKKRRREEISHIVEPTIYNPIYTANQITIGDKEYIFPQNDPPNVSKEGYEMNDREKFFQFIDRYMMKVHGHEIEEEKNVDCGDFDKLVGEDFSLLTHQKIVKDYMNINTPYRGLLLFHGLGSGKTCTSIAIAEAMKSSKRIIVMVPASLLKSYKNELKKCGDIMYRKDKHWDWVNVYDEKGEEKYNEALITSLSKVLGIDKNYIKAKKGAFLIDLTAPSNYGNLSLTPKQRKELIKENKRRTKSGEQEIDEKVYIEEQQRLLNEQIDLMIENKYTFIAYNGLRRRGYINIPRPAGQTNLFDNSVVIIDEGHNLISRIINKLERNVEFDVGQYKLNPKEAKEAAEESRKLAQEIKQYFASSTSEAMNKTFEATLKQKRKNSAFNLISPKEIEQLFAKDPEIVIQRLERKPDLSSKKEFPLSVMIYQDLMKAKNARVVVLSGTPIINKANEMGVLFNILRGYIVTHEIQIGGSDVNREAVMKCINKHAFSYVDYVDLDGNKLTITFNPKGFLTVSGTDSKVKLASIKDMSIQELLDFFIKNVLIKHCKVEIVMQRTIYNKALPDSQEVFESLYLDPETRKLKDSNNLQRRIMGLTSYFRSAQENLLPHYDRSKDYHVIRVPMSGLQFEKYMAKLEAEKKDEKGSDTYKMFTRLICNYAVNDRPYPLVKKKKDQITDDDTIIEAVFQRRQQRADLDDISEENAELDDLMSDVGGDPYREALASKVDEMRRNPEAFFSLEALRVHSPKFRKIIENIKSKRCGVGLNLIYSQFRSFEGLTLFSLCLEANGFTQFKLELKGSNWVIHEDCLSVDNIRKPKYGMYGDDGNVEKRDTLRSIYNGDWGNLNQELKEQLNEMFKVNISRVAAEKEMPLLLEEEVEANNNFGEIMKILMITSSGSEGINLKNTRYVHLMEPYWHPVRTEQVIGRARRICSHKNLDEEYRTVEVFLYLTVFSEEQKQRFSRIEDQKTTDEYLYDLCLQKELTNNDLTKAMKESSFDCNLYTHDVSEGIKCLKFEESKHYSYKPNFNEVINVNLEREKVEEAFIEAIINGKTYLLKKEADGNKYNVYDKAEIESGVFGSILFQARKRSNGTYEKLRE